MQYSNMGLSVIILAGGTGSRMKSKHPKILHKLGGKRLVDHVIDTVAELKADQTFVVYGHMGEVVHDKLKHHQVTCVEQQERLGTGHAVLQVLPYLNLKNETLILYGDVPLISAETLSHLVESTGENQLGLLTCEMDNPKGLGRIVRDEYHQVSRIVEEKDATDLERQIKEINTGIYCVPAQKLSEWLPNLKHDNAQQEYYLTDIVDFARQEKMGINVSEPLAVEEVYGANSRQELARLEQIYQAWQADDLMAQGVSLMDPSRVDIRGNVTGARDCIVEVNVIFEGEVQFGEDCRIGAGCILKNVILDKGVQILPYSILDGVTVKAGAQIGPFARVRPETIIEENAKIGNFVEVKKSTVGKNSKASHLSYLGNAIIEEDVNIGAGTITCNYDGVNKHQTTIKKGAFIGSNTALVAPVTVGENAIVGAGTATSTDIPDGCLAVTRADLEVIESFQLGMKR